MKVDPFVLLQEINTAVVSGGKVSQRSISMLVLGWDTVNSYVCFISKSPSVYRAGATPRLSLRELWSQSKPELIPQHLLICFGQQRSPHPSPSRLAPVPCESHQGQSNYSSKLKTVNKRIFSCKAGEKRNTEAFSSWKAYTWTFLGGFSPLWGNTQTHQENQTQQEKTRLAEPCDQQCQHQPADFPSLLSTKTPRSHKPWKGT